MKSPVRVASFARPSSPPCIRTLAHTPRPRPPRTRPYTVSAPRQGFLQNLIGKTKQPYILYQGTKHMYNACAAAASYEVPRQQRQKGEVRKSESGEDIGISTADAYEWHGRLGLLPTFSTWSQVTMLHMYLLVTRLRDIERGKSLQLQQQLTDAHFFDCEASMDKNHGITSAAMRQRYLKDIFMQWRGVILSYDEGLARGDAVLAAAVWRNLFGARPDVDAVKLATVVAWMRGVVVDLSKMEDDELLVLSGGLFRRKVEDETAIITSLISSKSLRTPAQRAGSRTQIAR